MSGLFRRQAIEKQKDKLQGDILLNQPISFAVITAFICLVVISVTVFLFLGKFARQETAVGFLLPDQGIMKVYSPQVGNVKKVLVSAGQLVSKGQALAVIKTSKVMTDGREANLYQVENLQKQRQILLNQIERLSPLFDNKHDELGMQIRAAEIDVSHINAQIKTSNKKLDIQAEQLTVIKRLAADGYLTQARVDEVEGVNLSLVAELQSFQRLRSQKLREIILLQQQKDDLQIAFDEQKDQLLSKNYQLEQRIAEAQSNHEFVLRAENAGTISAIQLKAGQRVTNQIPLFSIIPEQSVLQAELLIPTKAIGFVKEGQKVSLQYDAFPFQKFGLYFGEVSSISKNVLMPAELTNTPLPIDIPSYRVTVKLNSQTVNAYGQSFSLKPGIQFTANIRLDERSLLEWLLEPIYSLKGRFS
jgi:membrane fusion protein